MFRENTTADQDKIEEILGRRIEAIYPSAEEARKRLGSRDMLRVYLGIDPTGPELHLGHTIPILFLKQLLDLGHTPVLVIGDFTARIGDPTGKDATRKPLTSEEVGHNFKNYLSQIYKILPRGSFEVKYNSSWLSKMSFEDVVRLASHVTVQQMIARDMFQERIKKEKPIGVHEFLYPLMQGYDSVAMEIDGEVGGNDQTFNMLVGRELEKKLLDKDKLVFATKLLVGPSGKKMSKTEGELIALSDEPREIRRKVLMTDDSMTKTLFELCTEKSREWIEQNESKDPRELKEELSDELVRMYHGEEAVLESRRAKKIEGNGELVTNYLTGVLSPTSKSEVKNLLDQGAIEINGEVVKDWNYQVKTGDKIKVGKGKFLEVK